MKVLLSTLNAKYIHTNLAIRLLYDQNRHHAGLQWKEFTIKENQEEVAAYAAAFDVAAFSCYIWNITQTLSVAEKIKGINPECKILLGGPEVSYENKDLMTLPQVDYIIEGEGEIPFAAFLQNFPNTLTVPALVYKHEGEIKRNPAPAMFDLANYADTMPYAYDPPESLHTKVLYLETSRGCPYKCEFCLASLDNKVRYLPMPSLKRTLLHLMQHGKVIKFLDRTFNMKRDFTLDIFQFILDNHHPGNVFQFEITADILHPDIIRFIHEKVPKGLFRFEIGIQTVNQKANLEVSRKQNFEKTKKIIIDLAYKIEMHLDLIVGLPLDYWEDIRYSFNEVFHLFAPELQFGFLKFLKGTTMRHKPEHGFVFDPQPPYQIIESKYLSKAELAKIVQLEHALEIYWNSGKATNTLKYMASRYDAFAFLLGLGMHFGESKSYHRYSFTDVFDVLLDYAKNQYPNDNVLHELIGIDYYLHFKVKPQMLYLTEIDKQARNEQIAIHKLNHHRYRFAMLPLGFDFIAFQKSGDVIHTKQLLVLQYDGLQKAQVVPIHQTENLSV